MNKNCVAEPGAYPQTWEGQHVYLALAQAACQQPQKASPLPSKQLVIFNDGQTFTRNSLWELRYGYSSAVQQRQHAPSFLPHYMAGLSYGSSKNCSLHQKSSTNLYPLNQRLVSKRSNTRQPLFSFLSPGGAPSSPVKAPDADKLTQDNGKRSLKLMLHHLLVKQQAASLLTVKRQQQSQLFSSLLQKHFNLTPAVFRLCSGFIKPMAFLKIA